MFKSNKKLVIAIILCFALIGCTYFQKARNQSQDKIDKIEQQQLESVKFWNWLSSHALALNTNKNQFTDIAERSTDNITDLIGIPAKSNQIEVRKLLPTDTKLSVKQIIEKQLVEKQLSDRESKDSKLQQDLKILEEEKRVLTEKLTTLGAIKEKEQNSNIVKRVWRWSITTFGVGGLIALFIFVPPALPIFLSIIGHIFGWICNMFPKLMNLLGIAGKSVAENVVKGVGNARYKFKESDPNKTYTKDQVLSILDGELKAATNDTDRKVIEHLREKVNV